MNNVNEYIKHVVKDLNKFLRESFEFVADFQFETISEKVKDKKYTAVQMERIEKFCKGPVKSTNMRINYKKLDELIYKTYNLEYVASLSFNRNKTLNENLNEHYESMLKSDLQQEAWNNWGYYDSLMRYVDSEHEWNVNDMPMNMHVDPLHWFEAFVELGIIYFSQKNEEKIKKAV